MNVKVLSRIALGVGIALLISGAASVVMVSAAKSVAALQGALGLAAVAFFFATNRDALGRTFAGKATVFYGVSFVVGGLLVGALVGANYVAARQKKVWDLTRSSIFTLSDDTLKTLTTLPGKVSVAAFYDPTAVEAAGFKDLLDRYVRHAGDQLEVDWVDPLGSPELVKSMGIKEGGARVVVTYGENEARVKEASEEELTNALLKVLRSSEKKVYFTTGHGEVDLKDTSTEAGYGRIVARLANEGLRAEPLSLAGSSAVPADAAALAIVGPKKPFLEPELASLNAYLQKGGRLYVAMEPGYDDAGLGALLATLGIEFDAAMVVDPLSRLMGGGNAIPVVQSYAEHEITQGFSLLTVFPTARPLTALGDVSPRALPIALTNPTAWGETDLSGAQALYDESEERGALPIAVVLAKPLGEAELRIVAVGDSDFVNNQFESAAGNADFFLNSFGFLAADSSRITIRPRKREASRLLLTEADAGFLNLFSLNGLPMLVLALGLSVWLVRKAK